MDEVVFLTTGGTIDKDYPKVTKGWDFEIGNPAVPRIMERLSLPFSWRVTEVLRKDSQEITDDDRERIKSVLAGETCDRVIITHGTDTMLETAAYIYQCVSRFSNRKVIVLTGAVRPERFSNSDAPINIGVALAAVWLLDLEPGIYIAMNGLVIRWDKCVRDMETGHFVRKA